MYASLNARIRRQLLQGLAVGIVVALSSSAAMAQAKDPMDGVWKLNVAKSKYRAGPPPQSQIRTYEPQGEGVKATIVTIYADGRSTTVGYVAKYDSLEYAVSGSPDADTITLKRVAQSAASSRRTARH